MNYVNEQNMQEILDGIARKIGTGGTGSGLEDWQASHEYIYNDMCVYEGQIYRAKVGYTSDTTFSTTQILEEYTPVGGETIIPYEKDTEINIDDIVSYDNNTYKALYNFVCGEEFSLYALEEYVPQELTDDDIKEIVEAYNPVFEEAKGIEYSTEERRIGTWIDGKPLYRKVLLSPVTGSQFGLSNISVKRLSGVVHDTGSPQFVFEMPYADGEYSVSCNYNTATDIITINYSPDDWGITPEYIFIDYTKS